jgi:hypothetical protein
MAPPSISNAASICGPLIAPETPDHRDAVQQEKPIEQIFQPTAALLRIGFAKSTASLVENEGGSPLSCERGALGSTRHRCRDCLAQAAGEFRE